MLCLFVFGYQNKNQLVENRFVSCTVGDKKFTYLDYICNSAVGSMRVFVLEHLLHTIPKPLIK